MDIVYSDLEKMLQFNIKNNVPIENESANIYRSLKNTINVLLKLKESNLNHLDIKPCNILVNYSNLEGYEVIKKFGLENVLYNPAY